MNTPARIISMLHAYASQRLLAFLRHGGSFGSSPTTPATAASSNGRKESRAADGAHPFLPTDLGYVRGRLGDPPPPRMPIWRWTVTATQARSPEFLAMGRATAVPQGVGRVWSGCLPAG